MHLPSFFIFPLTREIRDCSSSRRRCTHRQFAGPEGRQGALMCRRHHFARTGALR
jgi:hypothetical protein